MTTRDSTVRHERFGRWAFACHLVGLLVLPFVAYSVVGDMPFVRACPSQYGKTILAVFLAGIGATLVSYSIELIFDTELKTVSRAALVAAVIPCGAICIGLMVGFFKEGRFDWLTVAAAALAACGGLASLSQALPWRREAEYWKSLLLYVDLPMLCVCLAVVAFKYAAYQTSTTEYNALIANTFPRPDYKTPAWDAYLRGYLELMRASFWVGLSTGVVGTQLLLSQVIALLLRGRRVWGAWREGADDHNARHTRREELV